MDPQIIVNLDLVVVSKGGVVRFVPLNIEKKIERLIIKKSVARRLRYKKLLVAKKGSCCLFCGYNKCSKALSFHHLDPTKKNFNLSRARHYSEDRVSEELKNTILVCHNCHTELHEGLLVIPEGFI